VIKKIQRSGENKIREGKNLKGPNHQRSKLKENNEGNEYLVEMGIKTENRVR